MEQTNTARKIKLKSREIRRVALTPLGLLGVLGCAALILVWLNAQIKLTDMSTINSKLLSSYSLATEESARLKLAYENAFNLTTIEREATAKLGMHKATELQVIYIGAESDDAVMILNGGIKDEGILGKITDIFKKLSEYIMNN
ncbi:MAG: hypothetical protein LBN43_08015 [Oscillospiraceae bacterium]|jgi:hypothetical protein|nr:hypothetical protein [Oscillospiraceae bacterium]